MKFSKGNKAAKGGKRQGAGRPSRLAQEAQRLAADLVKKYLEDHLKPVLDAYVSSATGKPCGKVRCKLDPATTRHAVERFVGPAPRSLVLDLQDSIETFFEEIQNMEEGDK